jgi:hypothetical protein
MKHPHLKIFRRLSSRYDTRIGKSSDLLLISQYVILPTWPGHFSSARFSHQWSLPCALSYTVAIVLKLPYNLIMVGIMSAINV